MIQVGLLFILISSLTSLLGSLIFGHLSAGIAMIGLIAGLGGAIALREPEDEIKTSVFQNFLYSGLFVVCSFQFLYLFFEKSGADAGYYTLNPNNLGDLPFHINMIRAFAKGLHFWPENPILLLETLKYPFGMNLFNAQLEILGIPLQTHLVLTGLGCLGLSLWALHRWMGLWGVLAFFLSGGFASFAEMNQGTSWRPESIIAWKNLFLAMFVTQRGMLFAIPAGAFLLAEFQKTEFTKKKKIVLGLVWGSLAFFHLHSFFIVSIIIALLVLTKKTWKATWTVGVGAAVMALPFLAVSLAPSPRWVSPVRIVFGWMLRNQENILTFLIRNFGTWLALIPILIWLAFRKKTHRLMSVASLLLMIVFFNLILAPWAWDQIKILCWCYLLINAIFAEAIFKHLNWRLQTLMALIVFYPGLVQLIRSMPAYSEAPGYALFKKSEIEILAPLLRDISPTKRILVAPRYDHPIFYFGQSVVMGYPGHVWAHGYSPGDLEEKIKIILADQSGASLNLSQYRELDAKYFLFSHYEAEMSGSVQGRDSAWTLVKVPEPQSE